MSMNKRNRLFGRQLFLVILLIGTVSTSSIGCAYYSFTGASIPAGVQTVAIPMAIDASASPLTGLDDEFTDQLIQRFVQQTRLSLEPDEEAADVVLGTRITRYRNDPVAVGGGERATLNRVALTVSARYYGRTEDAVILERTFEGSEEYDPTVDGVQGEAQAASAALEEIAQDIFNAATSDW